MSNFKQASKQQLRFQTSKGVLSVEQLWSLSQTELATCIRNVKKSLKKVDDDELSFLDSTVSVDKTEQLRFDILKEVYQTKEAEIKEAQNAAAKKEHNQEILALISEKEKQALAGKSIDELKAMIQ